MNPAPPCPHAAPIGLRMMLGQALLCVAALGVMLGWPPASGMMLAIPLGAASPAPLARAAGLSLVRQGPLPGSLVLFGPRAAIAAHAWHNNILLVAASAINCGPEKVKQS